MRHWKIYYSIEKILIQERLLMKKVLSLVSALILALSIALCGAIVNVHRLY